MKKEGEAIEYAKLWVKKMKKTKTNTRRRLLRDMGIPVERCFF